MNIDKFLNDLAANPSRNYKIDQLRANAGNEVLREVVRLALDPFTNFYIRKIPAYKRNDRPALALQYAIDQLFELSHRIVTGNAAIDHLTSILSQLDEEDAKVIERIIQKDLKCGVNISTANAVWGGLVVDYPVMLCSQYEDKLVNAISYPAYVQLKMDGMRFNAIVREGKVEFRSRNGKELHLLGNLEAEFAALAGDVDCVFDGELVIVEEQNIADRQTGNGILNKANKGTIKKEEAELVHAIVWDVIPYMYFVDGHCPVPYITRFDTLVKMEMPEKVKLVNNHVVNSIEHARELFESYLSQGQEGIILKSIHGAWENKRAKHQIKFKGEMECDLKIVGVQEGTGKYAGMLGAILCESADGVVKVSVGSGFNDEQRESLKEKDLLGKIVAVKYNARIKNKNGEESLFLPIFIEIREDKDIADSSEVIK